MARAAIEARELAFARSTMQPLIEGGARPTVRMCLLMAELEELDGGAEGRVREWLSRASRAPRDKTWVADGVASDVWAPVSPLSGKLDAFRWQAPAERLSAPVEPMPPETPPLAASAPEPELIEAPALPVATPVETFIATAPTPEAAGPEPTAQEAGVMEPAAPAQPAPAPSAQEDALTKLAAIRRSAKTETPRRAAVLPLIVAPDDPGPDAPRI